MHARSGARKWRAVFWGRTPNNSLILLFDDDRSAVKVDRMATQLQCLRFIGHRPPFTSSNLNYSRRPRQIAEAALVSVEAFLHRSDGPRPHRHAAGYTPGW